MGRPKKEEGNIEAPKAEIPNLRYKVLSVSDYLLKAREIFGEEKAWENALCLLYNENKVIQVIDKKGEAKFLCEI